MSILWGSLHGMAFTNKAGWDEYEKTVGKRQSVLNTARSWVGTDGKNTLLRASDLAAADLRGALPCYGWLPQKSGRKPLDDGVGTNAAILGGKWDAYIDQQAAEFAKFGKRMIMRFAHESNLSSSWPWCDAYAPNKPGSYAAMFRYVSDRVRHIAPKVEMWWCPNWTPAWNKPRAEARAALKANYPGDGALGPDGWFGFDAYCKPTTWREWHEQMTQPYDLLCNETDGICRGLRDDRFAIGEFGCASTAFTKGVPSDLTPYKTPQGFWTFDALTKMIDGSYDKLGMVVYYNALGDNDEDYRVETRPDLLQAFKTGIADNDYAAP